jgi:Protein of unknown function (DUF2577)
MAGERTINLIRQIVKETNPDSDQPAIVFGQVTSVDPITISVDSRLTLTREFLLLSPFCHTRKTTIKNLSLSTAGDPSHTHTIADAEITLWNGLAVGDIVSMIRLAKSQIFYVLHKGGILE